MSVVLVILIVLVLAAAAGASFAVLLARTSVRSQAEANRVPGVDVPVPASWAGSHEPEARLHRRIRDAARSLDATVGHTTAAQIDDRARLLVSAHELDERLTVIWELAPAAKTGPLADVERGVAALEAAVAAVLLEPGDGAVGRVHDIAAGIDRSPTAPPAAELGPRTEPTPEPDRTGPLRDAGRPEPPSSLTE